MSRCAECNHKSFIRQRVRQRIESEMRDAGLKNDALKGRGRDHAVSQ